MTAAGLAFIAGGLATLISFRAVLFGGGDDGEARPRTATRPARTSHPAPPEVESPRVDAVPVDNEPGRGRRLAAAFSGRSEARAERVNGLASIGLAEEAEAESREPRARRAEEPSHPEESWPGEEPAWPSEEQAWPSEEPAWPSVEQAWSSEEQVWASGEQAWPGEEPAWAGDEQAWAGAEPVWHGDRSWNEEPEPWQAAESCSDEPAAVPGEASRMIDNSVWQTEHEPEADQPYGGPPPRPAPIDRSDRGYGDRIDGWVRPRYPELDDRPPSGDYWTPVPDDLYTDPEPSARGYGWPVPVERLAAVSDYEPVSGFDLSPVEAAEPTTHVPDWPPSPDHRIRLPRSWAERDQQGRDERGRDERGRDERGRGELGRGELGRGELGPGSDRTGTGINREQPSWSEPARRSRRAADGPRPRPRPRPAAAESDSAYISRHAAGPHR
jgi:hypothetical protein